MKTRSLALILPLVLGLIFSSSAQNSLLVPKENLRANMNQTRSNDGTPGEKYWQNHSDYSIRVDIDVDSKLLSGSENIVYYNESPDSLRTIVVRLYQDIFKAGANRSSMVEVDPRDIHDGVEILGLYVNKKAYDISQGSRSIIRRATLLYISLEEKLAPGSSLDLDIDWRFKIPEYTLIRMGTIDPTSLFIGQWYPQIAVYDDVRKWDRRSYNGMAEFYSDFSNYKVEITVPDNFLVWATGEPTNLKETLQEEFYQKYLEASASDEIQHVVTQPDIDAKKITTNSNVWKFEAQNVTDFAFGISDHYVWDVTSVVVDPASQDRTVVNVAYHPEAAFFDQVAHISRETIRSMSYEMPGIPYPFPYLTVYNGDFGMEYPMITNVGADQSYAMTVYANSHEIAHGYIPFYVGSNETRNGWIDEGLVVYMPEMLQSELSPGLDIAAYNTAAYANHSGGVDEPAVITPTYYLDPSIYFYLNYAKTEQALRMLEKHLGKDKFKECLLAFFDRWKYKHPTPHDFFNTFNDVSGQDLNWFWKAWYYQAGGFPDLEISKATQKENELHISITNKGDLPMPIELSLYSGDELIMTVEKKGEEWLETDQIDLKLEVKETITKVVLGGKYIADSHPENNEIALPSKN